MTDTTTVTDVLAGDKQHRFCENSTPAVKPNSLPLNEINLPSFRDASPFSTSPNHNFAGECATSSNLYGDLSDKFGGITVNDYCNDVQLQRLQQKQVLLRQNQDMNDFSSSLIKPKLTTPDDARHFADHAQNHSPYKSIQTAPNPMNQTPHLQSPFYDQQPSIRSLIADNQPFQTTYNSLPPSYASYPSHDSLLQQQQDLNSLSGYFSGRARGDGPLAHLSPNVEELKSFVKSPDGTQHDMDVVGSFGAFMSPSVAGDNDGLKLLPPLKLSEYPDGANNYSSNQQLHDALLLKLRQQQQQQQQQHQQQNPMPTKQHQQQPFSLNDFGQYGWPKKDLSLRQALPNLTSIDEHFTKYYLSELLRANHLLTSMPASGLHLPFNFPNSHVESYSRKVFVGGLPPDSDEDEITASFRQFGPLIVDWPHKAETKTNFPPKGYCFLLFQDEMSVQNLIDACIQDDGKYYWCITCSSQKDKPVRRVQIRPWSLIDSDFVMDGSQPLDLRKTIFVGGVPRPLRAVELALAMERLYGGVCYAGIDTDPELKYPKGAGRVSFSNQQSYIAAISARFVQLQLGDIDKRVEVKPYVLDDQLCDECQGQKCAGKSAPYFCANVACLQYYCEVCWVQIHSRPGREFHKPLVKEGADRPKSLPPFKW